jgi:deoxycytidylate deaminase
MSITILRKEKIIKEIIYGVEIDDTYLKEKNITKQMLENNQVDLEELYNEFYEEEFYSDEINKGVDEEEFYLAED